MKKLINIFRFWNYFRNNNLDYSFYKFYDEGIRKTVRLRIYDFDKILHDIKLPSKDACRAEFLARLDGETPLQIWSTWRKITAKELTLGTQFWYFYGGWDEKCTYYDIFTINEDDIEKLKDNPKYINPLWVRLPNKALSV